MEEHKSHKGILFFLLAVAAISAILFFRENRRLENIFFAEENKIEVAKSSLSELKLEAESFSVYDIDLDREIYGANQNTPMPLASLAKTMTVALVVSSFEPEDTIYISKDALSQSGDYGLYLEEKWRVEDLAKLTLITSANDGAYALSETDTEFVEKMNVKARKIGMLHSEFLNSTGLDIHPEDGDLLPQAGAYASALDANLLASYGMRTNQQVFEVTTKAEITLTSESGFTHTFKNTDVILEKIPNLLFSKTGFTEVAGGNLSVVFVDKRGHKIAATVLGSTFEGRFTDMEKIVNVLYNQ